MKLPGAREAPADARPSGSAGARERPWPVASDAQEALGVSDGRTCTAEEREEPAPGRDSHEDFLQRLEALRGEAAAASATPRPTPTREEPPPPPKKRPLPQPSAADRARVRYQRIERGPGRVDERVAEPVERQAERDRLAAMARPPEPQLLRGLHQVNGVWVATHRDPRRQPPRPTAPRPVRTPWSAPTGHQL